MVLPMVRRVPIGRVFDPFRGEMLGKVAACHLETEGLHLPDALDGEQTHLPVPKSCVGIPLDAVILP
jgi:hypothetical protein